VEAPGDSPAGACNWIDALIAALTGGVPRGTAA
jgi:hypothetical protein